MRPTRASRVAALLGAALLAPAAAAARVPVEAGQTYEVLLDSAPPAPTVQLHIADRRDECWVEATVVTASDDAYRGFTSWNLCLAFAVRRIAGAGDLVTLTRKSVLAVDEEALDDFVALANRAEYQALVATGRVLPLPAGTDVVILAVGRGAKRVRIEGKPHDRREGLLYDDPW